MRSYSPCIGGIPPDGTPVTIVTTVFLPLSIVYFVAVAIGVSFAMVCLLFNCIFRNRKWVDFPHGLTVYSSTYTVHYHHMHHHNNNYYYIESSAWLVQISTTSIHHCWCPAALCIHFSFHLPLNWWVPCYIILPGETSYYMNW